MDHQHIQADLAGPAKALRAEIPEVMGAFARLSRSAMAEGELTTATKELIALAISVAIRCDGCVAFHSQAAVKQGATREEIMEVMGMALYMGAGPSLMYAAQAVEAYDQFAASPA